MYVSFYFFRQEHWLLSTRTGQFWSHMVGQKWVKDSTLKWYRYYQHIHVLWNTKLFDKNQQQMLKVRFFACIRTCSLKRDYLIRIHTENSCMYFSPYLKVAARSLEIPETKIHISETSTNTVPNTSATAASASSDLNGMAIKVTWTCVTISVSCNSKIFSHFLSLSFSPKILG